MIIRADARALPLQAGCVQTCVTSPPYFGLRDYGTATWVGGDPACVHRVPATGSTQNKGNNNREGTPFRDDCGVCGAHREDAQIGLEGTPDAYVASLVQVFREVRRVLKADGCIWINLGDSYANDTKWGGQTSGKHALSLHGKTPLVRARRSLGLKSKDLIGIPWRVAFALQADGWYLRSDIIWSKPNPMPESVTDRPTKAHEYLFLLSKQERYYYDAAAIAEPVSASMLLQMEQGYDGLGLKDYAAAGVQNPSDVKARIIENYRKRNVALARGGDKDSGHGPGRGDGGAPCNKRYQGKHAAADEQAAGRRMLANVADARANGGAHDSPFGLTRNKRSVWTINTQNYSGAHFATFPEQLIEPCILAGCPMGGLVLDPFPCSGTGGRAEERLGRRWVGTDLSYQPLATQRTQQRGLRFDERTELSTSGDAVAGEVA